MDSNIIFSVNDVKVEQKGEQIICRNGRIRMEYNITDGTAAFFGGESSFTLTGVVAEAKLDDGRSIGSKNLKRDFPSCLSAESLRDAFGEGVKLTITGTGEDNLWLEQIFYVYGSLEYLLTETVIKGEKSISTNYVAPISGGEVKAFPEGDLRFLFVPFDNDDFVRYAAYPLAKASESYEVTAVYDNNSRNALVTGSVSHDTWKTGITAGEESLIGLNGFKVFCGVTSKETRDTLPHGFIRGREAASAKIFLGFYKDYRDGLEAYGAANGIMAEPLAWEKGIPMGWNSWSAVAKNINYEIYVNSSDFVKEHLQPFSFSADGRAYMNFDAGWNRLTEGELVKAAEHVKKNGQIPGIYTTPFTFWGGKNRGNTVPGTDGQYIWEDLLLKDEQGRVLPPLDGGLSIDPSHPGNVMRLQAEFRKFKKWGFQYVKLDFMSHGAVEGCHYRKDITTGIAAYNYGMGQIRDMLKEEIKEQEFFLSLSIAPIFPGQYAHSRRISCDVFGTINWAEYMLNSLTYGWWLNNRVYRFNDPDHIVVYNSYNHPEPILFNEGLTRYISSAIAGTMMIDSDDFHIEEARERAAQILTNEEINAVAKAGIPFRPVEGDTEDRACDSFIGYDGKEKVFYLAVFNFSSEEKKLLELESARIGLNKGTKYKMYDLWEKSTKEIGSKITVRLDEAQPKIFKIYE